MSSTTHRPRRQGPSQRLLTVIATTVTAGAVALAGLGTSTLPAQAASSYKLPWHAGQAWNVTQGLHATRAWDFQPPGAGSHNDEVVAVATGVAKLTCSDSQGQAIVALTTAGATFRYVHLQTSAVTAAVVPASGVTVQQGQVLGRLHPSPPGTNYGCGYASPAGASHLHLEMPAVPSVLDGYTFSSSGPTGGGLTSTNSGPTAPAPTQLSLLGGAVAAFQANTSNLWTAGDGLTGDRQQGMMTGTSPSIVKVASGFQAAFQANTGALVVFGDVLKVNTGLGMMRGTSPALARLNDGRIVVAFQANTGNLWTYESTRGNRDWGLGMMNGTSPAITALTGGGYEVAFQANTGNLWTVGDAGWRDWGLGMRTGTSPAIAARPNNGFQTAFQANTSSLWTAGTAGVRDWGLGMMASTSPAITDLVTGGLQIAFQANTGSLWTVGDSGWRDWGLGMMAGTSPAITRTADGGFAAAFQANTGNLWVAGTSGVADLRLGIMNGTSPAVRW